MSLVQFHGPPCLLHSNYVFYKAFKYKHQEMWRILNIGDFFFAKIVQEMYDCICETELLWEDKTTCQILVSVRLYALPEHTAGGRQDDTGRDEVIALGERLVLRLEDLVQLIQHDVKWTYGCPTFCSTKRAQTNGEVGDDHDQEVQKIMESDQEVQGITKVDKSKMCEGSLNGVVGHNGLGKKRPLDGPRTDNSTSEIEAVSSAANVAVMSGAANVAVMSYPRYCRYRALQKRLEDCTDEWINMAAVVAIGGFSGKTPGCLVMFCRDTFYQAEIDDLDIRMDHMLPVLKGRGKGKKGRQLSRKDSQQDSDSMDELFVGVTPSISTSSRPRRLTESSEVSDDKVSTEEQAFLIGLHKFMHDAKMPIGRIPSLGFKQIDLYYFYKQAEQLGGYDSITHKRMWKHLYDKLGGNSSNTSAATCTRKHYERLLLPYERHLRKLKVRKVKKKHQKQLSVHESQVKVDGGFMEGLKLEDLKMEPKLEVKEEVTEPCVKENVRQSGSENLKYFQNESTMSCTDRVEPEAMEHSKPDPLIGSQASGIPISGHHVHKENMSSHVEVKDGDGTGRTQQLSFSQAEKLHQKPDPKVLSAPSAVGDTHAVSGVVYRGSYLVPVIPQMLHSPWGMLDPSSPSSAPTDFTRPHSVSTFKDPQGSSFHSSSKMNHNLSSHDIYPNSSGGKPTHSTSSPHKPSSSSCSSSSVLKAAHTNMPYKPSPYLLNDHIQPTRKCSQSFRHLSLVDTPGNSSQSLAALLHPTPPGHRSLLQLPPAPSIIYLHPSSTPSHLSPITSAPPTAHCYPRKRVYPFDSPTTTTAAAAPMMSMFPSPDMVLDQIRNSTGLPRISSTARLPSTRQQYEDPKKILAQAMPTSQSIWFPHREEPHHQPELTVSKQSTSKSRNSRKSQQTYSAYGQLPSSDLRHTLLQQGHIIPSSKTKVPDQSKPAGSVNGLVAAQQPMKSVQQPIKSMPSVIQASPVTSSIKDGRLTSALFGAQFTALPRQAKPSELPPAPTADSACATTAALSLNPHLHPAFMSPFLPGATTATPAGLSTQFQMLAGSYAAPSQLAAYEEMLRQNGYGAYLAAAAQGKLSKKN